ncbi:MAG: DUF2520 domain-containing protein [Solirubrobacteraceae bacterium]|nr:DUF2520 domain-containing protein [Solirubrobacteraceae bacterium]
MHQPSFPRFAVVGPGRLGTALHRALTAAGVDAGPAPLGRGASGEGADVVVLCVPDRAISEAAAAVEPGRLVVHTSGAGSVDLTAPHARRGMLHPLISVPSGDASLEGACAAVRATEPADAELLRCLAEALGMVPIDVAEEDRTAYHAAASLASNALVALQVAAAELAATAGVPASALQPLARAALAQVGQSGAAALTGPAARGDWATVAAQRDAIEARTPHLLPLFDATTAACAALADAGQSPNHATSESL